MSYVKKLNIYHCNLCAAKINPQKSAKSRFCSDICRKKAYFLRHTEKYTASGAKIVRNRVLVQDLKAVTDKHSLFTHKPPQQHGA